ncbi:MAG TPA: PTS sugar transporter subunit IIB [Anaeromyxobacteraceae bacterium]|nr:PTS sugar transporter subunit IIB [Anaeromyxobacteraceae bacterium]
MIALARIDERLVHGQVLVGWVPHLGAARLVVADEEAARSPLARAAMMLALPPGVEARVEPPEAVDWAGLAAAKEPALVVLRGVGEAERALSRGMTPGRVGVVNVGNVHHAEGRRQVTPSVFLSAAEMEGLRRLAAAGFRIEARAVPLDAPLDLAEMERRWAAAG